MSVPQSAYNTVKSIGIPQNYWDLYRREIANIESRGSGDYAAVGGFNGSYDGRYQLGELAKADGSRIIGIRNPGHSTSQRISFRNNPTLQEDIFAGYTKANYNYLSSNPKFRNATIERKLQILAYAHNQGWSGANEWLNTGVVGVDGFDTKGSKYSDAIASAFRSQGKSASTPTPTPTSTTENNKSTNNLIKDSAPAVVVDKDIDIDNSFSNLSIEEIDEKIEERRSKIDLLNEKSSDLWTDEEWGTFKQLTSEINALKTSKAIKSQKNCTTRQTTKGFTYKNTPDCETFFKSVANGKAISVYQSPRDLPNPCGTSELSKINTTLIKFFITLKGIKKYGNLYVTGSLNKISNITNLIRNTSQIISAVLKILINRLRNFLIKRIREKVEDIIDNIFPSIAKAIKNTSVQLIIDEIFCGFKDIIKNIGNIVVDFLQEMVGNVVNIAFCAAEQFTNALVNNVAAIVDKTIGPLLSKINDIIGGASGIVGNVFQALDFILGFESFLCAKPNCPEIVEFKASPWGGPSSAQIDDFNNFLAPLGGRQTPTAEGIIGSIDDYISDFEIFGSRIGDAPDTDLNCPTGAFECGPPKVSIFGGGGIGAVGEVIVDNIGRTMGVKLLSNGYGYTRPPFVSFSDSCENTFTSGYSVIDDNPSSPTYGQVTDIIMVNTPLSPPINGRTEFDSPDDFDDIESQINSINSKQKDYIVCLDGFRILNTGVGYTTDDNLLISPEISNLSASVKLTEFGQVIAIDISEKICGLTAYPEVTINSLTGDGVVIEPILSFIEIIDDSLIGEQEPNIVINVDSEIKAQIALNDIDKLIFTLRGKKIITEKQEFSSRDVIRIVDCIN